MNKLINIKDLEELQIKLSKINDNKKIISVCSGSGCRAYGSESIFNGLKLEISKNNLSGKVILKRSGCHGFCEKGPIVIIHPEKIIYMKVKPEDAVQIITKTIINGEILEHLIWNENGLKAVHVEEIPFYKHQKRIIIENNSKIDPSDINDYIACGGYKALAKVLSGMKSEEVIDIIKSSFIRGRGGAGFPTGIKWESTRNNDDKEKYVVVNGDEGDPGAFMDGSILEGNPHSVIEGLLIGAYAIGAGKGFLYIRQEYPLALKNTLSAIKQAKEYGLIGENILGSNFSIDVEVHRGAGAFVSGESSAMVSAIEGNTGEPKLKYIRTSRKGLWDKPTNINNVETWANIPMIINNGAQWFSAIGTEKSKGTKIFSLVGKVKNTGLVEVPMGTTLRKIIFDIGGGMKNNRKFKSIQIGGPSGGCLPESHLDTPVDYDELTKHGAMMGSGGLIVMDEDSCMVDISRYFLNFLLHESCGKCIPCREGLYELLQITDRIVKGQGILDDLDFIDDISELLDNGSLCALGSTASNPIKTALRYFRNEFIEHIVEKKCSAGVCKELLYYSIDNKKCIGCGKCKNVCPVNAISGEKSKAHSIDLKKCTKCGSCIAECPAKAGAINKYSPLKTEKQFSTAGSTVLRGESV
jgi:NADH-quinone oxidoreductase subunit F